MESWDPPFYSDEYDYWIYNGFRFKRLYGSILEIFSYGYYGFLSFDGLEVIDVSGFTGDLAIYFISRGAYRVIALEPHPKAFGEMIENIRSISLEDRIISINAELSNLRERLRVTDSMISET